MAMLVKGRLSPIFCLAPVRLKRTDSRQHESEKDAVKSRQKVMQKEVVQEERPVGSATAIVSTLLLDEGRASLESHAVERVDGVINRGR